MNFKDIYKEANDEIKGDRKMIEGLFDGTYKMPAKKKSPAKLIYAFGSIAAAAVILFAVTYMPDFKNVPDEKITPPEVEIQANEGEKKIKEAVSADTEETDTEKAAPAKEETAPAVKDKARTYEKKETLPEAAAETKAETAPVEAENENAAAPGVTYSMSASAPVEDSSELGETENGITSFAADSLSDKGEDRSADGEEMKTKTASGGASVNGGGGAANSALEPSAIPVGEFFTVLGFDKERLSLPGYELKMPETADMIADNEGNILSLAAEFYLEGASSHISVTLSKGGTVTEKTVTVFDGGVSAYADNGRVSAYISALGTDESTVSDYMDKIMKEE